MIFFKYLKFPKIVELKALIQKIKEIQRNNSQTKKLLAKGLDIEKILEFGHENLNESIETIKSSSFLDVF